MKLVKKSGQESGSYNDKASNSYLLEVHVFQSDLFSPNKVVLDDSPNLPTSKLLIYIMYYSGFVALQQKYRFLVQLSVFCCSDLHVHILLYFFLLQLKWRKICFWHVSNNTQKNWKWQNLRNFSGNEIKVHNRELPLTELSIKRFSCISMTWYTLRYKIFLLCGKYNILKVAFKMVWDHIQPRNLLST